MTKKAEFLQQLNEAFAASNTAYIAEQVTDDIRWHIIGNRVIEGKEAFVQTLNEMANDKPFRLIIENIITHGTSAAVHGTMQGDHSSSLKTYAFCDVYKFSTFKNLKVKEIISYVLETQ